MCTYTYQFPLNKRGTKEHCLLSSYFQHWEIALRHLRTKGATIIEGLELLTGELPVDHNGHCIFHSRDIKWKVEHQFALRLQQLWAILEALDDNAISLSCNNDLMDIDLRECVFVGAAVHEGSKRFVDIRDLTFRNRIVLTCQNSIFEDTIRINNVNFEHVDWDLKGCRFKEGLQIHNSSIGKIAFDKATFSHGCLMTSSQFNHTFEASEVNIVGLLEVLNNQFYRDVYFNASVFNADRIHFDHNQFGGRLDFSSCIIEGDFNFMNSEFYQEVRFIDTIFKRTCAFMDNQVDATLAFKSSNIENKVFLDLVHFNISSEQLNGKVLFERVNYMNIVGKDRKVLAALAKENKVMIGKECIKYQLQSDYKTLYLDDTKQSLVIELAHAFASYFIRSEGLNLGIEIFERSELKVIFYYYSDEPISEEAFLDKLAGSQRRFLSLLFLEPQQAQLGKSGKRKVIDTVDSYASLIGLFTKVSVRIAAGEWDRRDTQTLWSAINFTKDSWLGIDGLHQLIVEKFSTVKIIHQFTIADKDRTKTNQPKYRGDNRELANKILENSHHSVFGIKQIPDLFHVLNLPQDVPPGSPRLEGDKFDPFYFGDSKNGRDLLPQEYDGFLSFAEEDALFAEELYAELMKYDLKIWFSKEHLRVGDSILGGINEAISRSRYGIVLLSKHTFSDDKHFPLLELKAIINKEIYANMGLLPIYVDIDHRFVVKNGIIFSDYYAINNVEELSQVAQKIFLQIKK